MTRDWGREGFGLSEERAYAPSSTPYLTKMYQRAINYNVLDFAFRCIFPEAGSSSCLPKTRKIRAHLVPSLCLPPHHFVRSGIPFSSLVGRHSLTKGKKAGWPGMYFCSTLGTLKPSGVWKFSSRQHSVRSVAQSVPLRAWTYSLRVAVCFLTPG
jgi:hypothetical protein